MEKQNKMKYYHNNRCRKSREGLAFLESKNIHPEIINYLEIILQINTTLNNSLLTSVLRIKNREFDNFIFRRYF